MSLNKTQQIANDFMKSSRHQDYAENLVQQKVKQARNDGWTKQQTLEELNKKGYLKTDMDKKIVKSVLQKNSLRQSKDEDQTRYRKANRRQGVFNNFVKQSREPLTFEDVKALEKNGMTVKRERVRKYY